MTESGLLHAVVWSGDGFMNDLGSEGLNSFAFGINDSGVTVGQAKSPFTDPGGEDFCGTQALGLAGTGATCARVCNARRNHQSATDARRRKRVCEGRERTRGRSPERPRTPPSIRLVPSPQKYQFKPVLWQGEEAIELPTADGDRNGSQTASMRTAMSWAHPATASPTIRLPCHRLQSVHALLWETGRVIDLGNLGGKVGHSAHTINNNGEVVGTSDSCRRQSHHAFRWTRNTGIQDLGTVPGDGRSSGLGINDQGVITGISVAPDFSSFRAFVWSGGVMSDLNQLIPATPLCICLRRVRLMPAAKSSAFRRTRTETCTHIWRCRLALRKPTLRWGSACRSCRTRLGT